MFECDSIHYSESLVVLTAIEPESPIKLMQDMSLRYKNAIVMKWQRPLEDGGSPLIAYVIRI